MKPWWVAVNLDLPAMVWALLRFLQYVSAMDHIRSRMPRRERWLLAAALVCSTLFPVAVRGMQQQRPPNTADTAYIGGIRVIASFNGSRSVLSVDPAQMPDAARNAYRLKPDLRFMLAAARLPQLVGRPSATEILVQQGLGTWLIRLGADTIGSIPENAGYDVQIELLRTWANRLVRQHLPALVATSSHEVATDDDVLFPAQLAAALDSAQAGWPAAANRAAPAMAARHLTVLLVQMLDELSLGDAIAGQALALSALAHALGATDPRSEVLLASLLEYQGAAERMAPRLDARDPIRMHVLEDTAALRGLAGQPGASRLAQYLDLLTSAKARSGNQWADKVQHHAIGRELSAALLTPAIQMRRFYGDSIFPPLMPLVTLYEGWLLTGNPDAQAVRATFGEFNTAGFQRLMSEVNRAGDLVQRGAMVQSLEQSLAVLAAKRAGPLVGPDVFATFLNSNFYSSIKISALYEIDGDYNISAGIQMARDLRTATTPIARLMASWIQELTNIEQGEPAPAALLTQIRGFTLLGASSAQRSYEALKDAIGYGDGQLYEGARRLAARFDARPSHQLALAWLASNDLNDHAIAHELFAAAIPESGTDGLGYSMWLSAKRADVPNTVRMIEARTGTAWQRASPLAALVFDSLIDVPTARRLYDQLYQESGRNLSMAQNYWEFLEAKGDVRAALGVQQDWWRNGPRADVLSEVFALNAEARFREKLGDLSGALNAGMRALPSRQGGAMLRTAVVLQRTGRSAEALELARHMVEVYPASGPGRAALARILWAQRRYDEVPEVLSAEGYQISAYDWRMSVGPAFADEFAERTTQETAAAFTALYSGGVDLPTLQELPLAFAHRRRFDVAFALQSILKPTLSPGSLELPIRAYGYLRQARNATEALSYIRQAISPIRFAPAAMMAYYNGEYDLLWTLIDRPEATGDPDYVWLMRAAAHAQRPVTGQRLATLRQHYAADRSQKYHTIGRFLMGLGTRDAVLGFATDASARCQVAYYIGLQAQAAGRFLDAMKWYRAGVETGQSSDAECAWANRQLEMWGSTLERVQVIRQLR